MNLSIFRLHYLLLLSILLFSGCQRKNSIGLPIGHQASLLFDNSHLKKAPSFRWESQTDSAWSMIYEGDLFEGKPTEVFAYYASPATINPDRPEKEKYPGIVLVHGGGGTAFRVWVLEWAKRGYAAIAMDLGGSRPAPPEEQPSPWATQSSRLENGGPPQNDSYKFFNIQNPIQQQWQYHAVANIIRAHSLLLAFPDTDQQRTALTGISWGGYLTNLVSGIDHRFKAAVPVYGCGFLHENSVWLDRFDTLGLDRTKKWIQYWEPSRYVGNARMPMLFINGTNDFAYPVESWQKTVDLASDHQLLLIPQMRHNHEYGAKPKEIEAFVNAVLNKQYEPFSSTRPTRVGNQLQTTINQAQKLESAELVYTTQQAPNQKREWKSSPATINGITASAALPSEARLAYFFFTDKEGNRRSSPVFQASQYSFDFEHPEDLNWWVAETEGPPEVEVQVDEHALDINASGGATVWFKQKLQSPVQISYTVKVVKEGSPNDRVSDLNCFWMAADPRCPDDIFSCADTVRTGKFGTYHQLHTYYVGYGGHDNTKTRFRRYSGTGERPLLPQHDLGAPHLIVPNRLLQVQITVKDGRTTYAMNGKVLFDIQDDAPYQEGWFAFRTVRNHMRIEEFKVVSLR